MAAAGLHAKMFETIKISGGSDGRNVEASGMYNHIMGEVTFVDCDTNLGWIVGNLDGSVDDTAVVFVVFPGS